MSTLSSINIDFSNLSKNQILSFKDTDSEILQSYINQINEIKNIDWNNINIVQGENFKGFDVESAKLYAKALDGVEASQASLLLSTQGLTNAEIQRVLAQQQLTTEQQYTALSTAGLLKSTHFVKNKEGTTLLLLYV